jgi:hypothetical protein
MDVHPLCGVSDPRSQAGGVMALSPTSRVVLAFAVWAAALAAAVHLGLIFLHLAPSNTVSKQHDSAIDTYVFPEYEQNWKLFAPNPLQQNIAVHARAEVHTPSGALQRTEWVSLTATDAEHIRGNLVPSHVSQNELRRAWDFFDSSHDTDNNPTGLRGDLSEQYFKRIVMMRLGTGTGEVDGGRVQRIQVRSATDAVPPPRWSGETVDTETKYRELSWWPVTDADIPGGRP